MRSKSLVWIGVIVGLGLGGVACKTASLNATPKTQAEILDCERRVAAMSNSTQDMRAASPREVVEPRQADPQPVRWGNGNNPCRPQGQGNLSQDAVTQERDARDLAKVRVRNFISAKDYKAAQEALASAFQHGTPEDPELYALSLELEQEYVKLLEVRFVQAQTDASKRHCHFSASDFAVERAALQIHFLGEAPIYMQCGLPDTKGLEQETTSGWLVVRRRAAPGHYELVHKRQLGPLSELTNPINLKWTPDAKSLEDPEVYLEATILLIDDRNNQSSTAREGFFWFDREPAPPVHSPVVEPEPAAAPEATP